MLCTEVSGNINDPSSVIALQRRLGAPFEVDYVDLEWDQVHARRLVVKSFNDMGLSCFEPRGAFYAFPCIKSSGMSSEEFCTKLLEQKHVAIIPGNAFGASGEGYARVSYAYSVEHLMEAIRRIREFLNENCK